MRNVIIDAIVAMTLLIVCAPLFAWLSDLAENPEQTFGTTLEMAFFLLMMTSIIGGVILAFHSYLGFIDTRDKS